MEKSGWRWLIDCTDHTQQLFHDRHEMTCMQEEPYLFPKILGFEFLCLVP